MFRFHRFRPRAPSKSTTFVHPQETSNPNRMKLMFTMGDSLIGSTLVLGAILEHRMTEMLAAAVGPFA